MSKVIGIDLGTTNSCVAIMSGGDPVVIANAEGSRTTPSVVAITDKSERLVGQIAKRQAITNPENTIFSVKRLMGRKFKSREVQEAMKRLPYKVVEADNGDAHVELRGKRYSPPEISAIVLQRLKLAAEEFLGDKITEAIITVPAYFDHVVMLNVRLIASGPPPKLRPAQPQQADERLGVLDPAAADQFNDAERPHQVDERLDLFAIIETADHQQQQRGRHHTDRKRHRAPSAPQAGRRGTPHRHGAPLRRLRMQGHRARRLARWPGSARTRAPRCTRRGRPSCRCGPRGD